MGSHGRGVSAKIVRRALLATGPPHVRARLSAVRRREHSQVRRELGWPTIQCGWVWTSALEEVFPVERAGGLLAVAQLERLELTVEVQEAAGVAVEVAVDLVVIRVVDDERVGPDL